MRRRRRNNRNLAAGGGQCWQWCRRLSSCHLGPVGRQHRAPGAAARLRPGDAVGRLVDSGCVRHRAGRAAAARRAGRRQHRAPGVLPGRARDLRHRVAGLRGGPGPAGADRLPGAAGGRGRRADAHLTRACAVGVPAHVSGAPRSGYGRASARSPLAAARCSAACWSSRAGAGSSSSTCPSSSPPWRQAWRSCRGAALSAAAGGLAFASTAWEPSWCWARWGWCAPR